MRRTFYIRENGDWIQIGHSEPRYKFVTFLIDLILVAITGGLWLFWIGFKFLRTGHR